MIERHLYPPEVIAALFDAVEMDDIVDPVVSLPDPIPMACGQEKMRRCLDLSIQFWREGAIRSDLLALTSTLLLTADLPQDARRRYKLIRARYKQLRFALVLYSRYHRAPLLFRITVAVLGNVQDAYRHQRRFVTTANSLVLRLLLTWPFWVFVRRSVMQVQPDDADGFLHFRLAEFDRLKSWLATPGLTAHRFHAMRKVVSRQVSFYDAMRTLEPDDRIFQMSRFLSAINGLMGSLHDKLVEGAASGRHDYHRDVFVLPDDIRVRLQRLAEVDLR